MKNSYNIIAKFNYNNRNYFITLVKNNKIVFVCEENGNLKTDLSKEEYMIINTVYESLRVNPCTSIGLGIKNIDGKLFRIFYDVKSKNHYWELENKNEKITEKENIKLNFRYNNVPSILYDNRDNNEEYEDYESDNKSNFYTKFVKIGKKILSVFVQSTIVLTVISQGCYIANPTMYREIKHSITESIGIEKEYNFENIRSAIQDNPNLIDSEKDFLYKFKFVFDENNKYMDLSRIIDRLSDLKITYIDEKCPNNDSNGYVTRGTYNILDNNITMYETDSFETCDIKVLTHELGHVFQRNSSRFSMELSNELFARETLRKMYDLGLIENTSIFKNESGAYANFGNGYNGYMYLYYRLAEIMSKEDLIKYQFTCDEDIIISALAKIDRKEGKSLDGIENAYKFLDTMDEMRTYNTETNFYDFNNNKEAYRKSCEYLDDYYKKKNGTDPAKDLNNAVAYRIFNPEELLLKNVYLAIEETALNAIEDDVAVNYKNYVFLPKMYLYNEHPNPSVSFQSKSSDDNFIIEITDDQSYKKSYKKWEEIDANNREIMYNNCNLTDDWIIYE